MSGAASFIPLSRTLADARAESAPVCWQGDHVVTWKDFSERVARLANGCAAWKASSVVLTCEDPLNFLAAVLALWRAGRTVIVPPNFRPETVARVAREGGPMFTDHTVSEFVDSPMGGDHGTLSRADCRLVLYTSGSSGEPKRVDKTLSQLEDEVATLESLWGRTISGCAVLATVPHHHIYGLLFRLLWPLAAGRAFDCTSCFDPVQLRESVARHPAHVVVSSPAHLIRFPQLIDPNSWVPRPRLLFSSGGPLPANIAAAYWAAFGSAPVEIFGSTETGGVAWRQRDGNCEEDAWTPLPGLRAGQEASGALVIDSPFLHTPNWRMDDAITLLPDGRFRLEGRLDRIVKLEGKRLSLPEMEQYLGAHAWVKTAAVVELVGGARLGAVIVPTPAGWSGLSELGRREIVLMLRRHLSQSFETVLLPRRYRFVSELPTSDRGKVTVAALRALFLECEMLEPEILGETRDGDTVTLRLRIGSDIAHFIGHFPGMPILPGVVQVDWAVRLARRYFAGMELSSGLENLKFQALVRPHAILTLTLKHDRLRNTLQFGYQDASRVCSSGRIRFQVQT